MNNNTTVLALAAVAAFLLLRKPTVLAPGTQSIPQQPTITPSLPIQQAPSDTQSIAGAVGAGFGLIGNLVNAFGRSSTNGESSDSNYGSYTDY